MDKIKVPNTKITNTLDQGFGRYLCQGLYGDKKEKVVVEICSTSEGASSSDVSDLLERIDLYKQLNHPNISKFVDGGDLPDGGAYLSIEMEDDVRLIDRLKNNEWLSPKEATALIIDLARALQEVHKLGIIHGELRPSNILFNPDTGHVKLRNIFRYKHEKDYVLKMVSRRPEYAAPEQIRFLEVDFRTDMYPLGIIFYQMLTGHHPVEGKNLEEIWRFHLEGDGPFLSEELQVIRGLKEALGMLVNRRRKQRYETDAQMIKALEDVYDHMFVEEESSMGRMVTLESSASEREEKKKKGKPQFDPHSAKKREGDKPEKVQPWKKGERRKLKANHSRRLSQVKEDAQAAEETKKQMKGPLIFAGVALVVLLVITRLFFQGEDIEQPEFSKNIPLTESEINSVEDPKPIAQAETQNTTPNKPRVEVSLKDAMSTKKKPSGGKKANVKIPEKFESKLDEVKFYGKLPPEQALEKLKLFLDDEEMSVRMLAVQLYQELKHKTFVVGEDVESMSEFDMMKLKLKAPNKAVPIKLMDDLAKNPTSEQIQILNMALDNPLKEVRDKALANLLANKNEETFGVIAQRVIDHPGEDLYSESFVKFGESYIPNLEKLIDEKGDVTALKFINPLLLMGEDNLANRFKTWAETRPTIALHVAMELAQLGEVGIGHLIDLFKNTKKDPIALTFLSGLREANLSDAHLETLTAMLGQNISAVKKTRLLRLLALRQPSAELLKDQTGAEQQAVTLMFISEMKTPPDNLELQRLVELLGQSSRSIDERIVGTLESEGARSHRYLMPALKNRLNEEIKIRLIEVMASFGDEETLSQLLNLSSSSSTLSSDLKELIYKKLFLSGDKLISITLNSKLNLKEKINLLIDLNSTESKKSLIDYLGTMKSVEFKKAYAFILDRSDKAQPIVEDMLGYKFEDDIVIAILKSLEKTELDLSPNLFVNLMNHENSKVRDEIFDLFEVMLEPSHEVWATLYDQAKHVESKELILEQVGSDSMDYSSIIYKAISEEEEDLRIAGYEKVTKSPLAEEEYNSSFTNKLYEEENKKALTLLINHLLKRPGGPSLPYCIWSKNNGSRTIRKVTDAELAKVSGDIAKVDELQGYLIDDYHIELRVDILKFLNQIKIDYLPFLFDETNISDKTALELLREGVNIQSKKAAPVLLAKLSETKNSQLKKEIETMLNTLKVSYKLDPDSGKYILK